MHAAGLLLAITIKSIGILGPITGSQDTAGQVQLEGGAALATRRTIPGMFITAATRRSLDRRTLVLNIGMPRVSW